jgi:hypothetical protein
MSIHTTALVTGASAGLGAAFAERFAKDGRNVVLVSRTRESLDDLATSLNQKYGVTADVIAADLSRPDERRRVEDRLAADPSIGMLVNNAGSGGYMPFTDVDPDAGEAQLQLLVIAVMRLTGAVLPGLIARGRGDVINVSSRLAYSGAMDAPRLPQRALYAAGKSFVSTFTEIVANEVKGTGVRVQSLCPGLVRTEFHKRMGMDPTRFPAHMIMEPDAVVSASLAGLERGEVVCIPALEDTTLLDAIHASEKHMFESSATGTVATRYR